MGRLHRKQINRLIRSGKDEFPLPEGLADTVRASLGGVTRSPRRRGRAAWKVALASAAVLGAALLVMHFHAPSPTHVPAHRVGAQPLRSPAPTKASQPPAHHVGAQPAVPLPNPAPTKPPLLALISAHPPVMDGAGKALRVGSRVPAGATVQTGAKGRATFVTRQGSEFTLAADSELALASDGRSARLRAGHLYCRNRLHEFTEITTAAGDIRLLGTALDAEVQSPTRVAVTVVEGRVQLANAHGQAVVSAGRKALLIASLPPDEGAPANVVAETAWYDGRNEMVSDYGKVAYMVRRDWGPMIEIWTMNADGRDRQRVKTYLGFWSHVGPWVAGEQLLFVAPTSLTWGYPDLQARRGLSYSGWSVLGWGPGSWLLNVGTAVDAPFSLEPGFSRLGETLAISPDRTQLVVQGYAERTGGNTSGSGVWIYNLESGALTQVTKTPCFGTPKWAPDGSALVMPLEFTKEKITSRLCLVNAVTGEIVDFGVQATHASFSPDGNSIVYTADFRDGITGKEGSLFVRGVTPDATPVRISPAGEGAVYPEWSPDGRQVLYWVFPPRPEPDLDPAPDTMVRVVAADGSGVREIYRGKVRGLPHWDPSGRGAFVRTDDQGLLLVATDGSGDVMRLGGTADDSVLSPAQRADTDRALTGVKEAVFQFSVGAWRAYQGRMQESTEAFRQSAALFASLPWSCPNADLAVGNVMGYAETAQALADRPVEEAYADVCQTHLSHLRWLLWARQQKGLPLPASLEELIAWARATQDLSLDHWLSTKTDDLTPMLSCPKGGAYLYQPQIIGTNYTGNGVLNGDVLLTCPHEADHAAWYEERTRLGLSAVILKEGSNLSGRPR